MPLRRFLSHLQYEKRYSAHTLKAYESDLKDFLDYVETRYSLTDLPSVTHFFIRSWIVELMDSGMNARSVNRKITSLKTFFRFLLREKLVEKNPMIRIRAPKMAKRLPAFVDEQKMEKLFGEIVFNDSFEGRRDRTLLELFYGTGMRLSELIGLEPANVNFHNQTVKVLGKRNKERMIPLGNLLTTSLRDYQSVRDQHLKEKEMASHHLFFDRRGNKMYPKLVYRIVKRYLGAVTTGEKKNPHILRHTFATHMLNHGAEINAVKELLGHASLAATQVYTHNTIEKLKNIYKQAHPKA